MQRVCDRKKRVVFAYEFASLFLGLLPTSYANALAYAGGLVAFIFSPNKRRLVADNLRRASNGDRGSFKGNILALRGYFSYARYWVEALALGGQSRRELNARMGFYGFEHVYEALGHGKGLIFTTPHLGNWDFGAAWLSSGGHPITAVMEELEPRELFDWFAAHRVTFGVHAIPASAAAFGELAKTVGRNQVVALVADRDIANSGVKLPFFGEVTSLPQGVALLSLRTGAPIIPAAVYMLPGGCHYVVAMKPITFARSGSLREDVSRLTGLLTERYESLIRADPAQWHLFQPNWPSQSRTGDSPSTKQSRSRVMRHGTD
jgi:KDO2-lipid IV(A) lauroyltransferase